MTGQALAAPAAPIPMTIERLAALPPNDQEAYISSLNSDQQAQVRAALASQSKQVLLQRGADFLARTIDKTSLAVMANGGALSQGWPVGGGTLTFNIPQTINGWIRSYIIRFTATITNGAGTSAVYGLTPAGVFGLFPEVVFQYGNVQQRFPLKVWADLKQVKAKMEPLAYEPVLGGGRAIASIDTYLNGGSSFGVAVGANTWTFEVEIPANLIHSLDVRGMIPLSAQQTPVQVVLTCNAAPFGADPLTNALYAVSGSGHTTVVSAATITVLAKYRDGFSFTQRQKMTLDVENLPTMQFSYDGTLNSLAANQSQPYQIKHIGRHYYVLAYVIDAQASNTFCADTNLVQLDVVQDAAGTNALWRVGGDTNVSVNEFLADLRKDIKQDLPEGVIPFIYAPGQNTVNPDNMDGIAVFDNTPGNGWPGAQFRVKIGAVGAVGNGPRIQYYTVYETESGFTSL